MARIRRILCVLTFDMVPTLWHQPQVLRHRFLSISINALAWHHNTIQPPCSDENSILMVRGITIGMHGPQQSRDCMER